MKSGTRANPATSTSAWRTAQFRSGARGVSAVATLFCGVAARAGGASAPARASSRHLPRSVAVLVQRWKRSRSATQVLALCTAKYRNGGHGERAAPLAQVEPVLVHVASRSTLSRAGTNAQIWPNQARAKRSIAPSTASLRTGRRGAAVQRPAGGALRKKCAQYWCTHAMVVSLVALCSTFARATLATVRLVARPPVGAGGANAPKLVAAERKPKCGQ